MQMTLKYNGALLMQMTPKYNGAVLMQMTPKHSRALYRQITLKYSGALHMQMTLKYSWALLMQMTLKFSGTSHRHVILKDVIVFIAESRCQTGTNLTKQVISVLLHYMHRKMYLPFLSF